MHDLIREMCLRISKFMVKSRLIEIPEEQHWTLELEKVFFMSSEIEEIPDGFSPRCRNLSTLTLQSCTWNTLKFQRIPESFFLFMTQLRVLDLSYNKQLECLPNCISNLENLCGLFLQGCEKISCLPALKKLRALRVLNIEGCDRIREFPQDMECLVSLQYLNMRHTSILLPEWVISKLRNLVEFTNCYDALHNFNTLLVKKLEQLVRYYICVGRDYSLLGNRRREVYFDGISFKGEIKVLLPANISYLEFRHCEGLNGCVEDNTQSMSNLRELRVDGCKEVEWILNSEQITETASNTGATPFKRLKKLELSSLPNLTSVCKGEDAIIPYCTFSFLKHLSIYQCDSMKKLLPQALLQNLKHLETLRVTDCRQLEVVIGVGDEEGIGSSNSPLLSSSNILYLPRLKQLLLDELPKLKSICNRREMICPSIEFIIIWRCKNVKRMPSFLPINEATEQPYLPSSFQAIQLYNTEKEWWESLEWHNPNAKDILQSYIKCNKPASTCKLLRRLPAVGLRRKLIKRKGFELTGTMPDIPTSPGFDEIVVGFENETENITGLLITGPRELNVVSITGMAGLGKTTLARKVFCHKPVIDRFHFRAWCCVSQEYDKNCVFYEIFSQVANSTSEDNTDEVLLEILMKKCKDEQSWVDTAEALRMALQGKCKGHKIRDDTTEVLYESLIKMSKDDNRWKKISSTLRESIMEKCKNTKNWGDIAKPLYDSLIVNYKDKLDSNVKHDAAERSPKFPMERHKGIKMWEEITSAISQSKIVDKKDIRRTDDNEVQELFKSLLDLAEVLFKNINEKCKENDSWNKMLKTLFKSLNDIVETLLISLNKKCKEDDNIGEKLRKKLLGQRYLIVLDDIWRTEAWDELRRAFPLGTEGSRIILTSREYDVGKYAWSDGVHSLRFFTTEESQDLLQLRLSKENVNPPELKEFGRQIAERCGGVPLVVVLVAGILKKKIEEKYFSWNEFLQSLSSHIRGDESQSVDVNHAIALSYKHLPEHLKPCFLYFGAFPEDYEIPVSKLIQLWMAEGFVKEIETNVLEDEAKDYLNRLIDSNLVMVSTRGYNGSVRTCRIHDMVGSFCVTKAKKDKFLMQTDSEQTRPHSEFISTYDRFCLHKRNDKDLSPDSAMSLNPSLGILLCFSSHNLNLGTYSIFAYDVDPSSGSWVASTFKHVRVLDLESIIVGKSFLFMVEFLLCLRYLAVSLKGQGSVSPPSLEHLHHLETFKVKSSGHLHLPFMIWNLEGLRHLHIDHYCQCCLYRRDLCRIPLKPLNLQTSSILILFNSRWDENLLRKFPHLQKLRCRFSTTWYKNCNRFPELGFLDRLESLEACHTNEHLSAPIHSAFDFPPSLKELKLHEFRLPWDNISVIAKLPRLESLELFSAFDGEQWDVEEENFSKLKFLRICESRIARWNATAESFPKLERLVLAKCRRLEELPYDFQYIITLQVIEIDQCNSSVARSAEKIQEGMVEELGKDDLIVHILNSGTGKMIPVTGFGKLNFLDAFSSN